MNSKHTLRRYAVPAVCGIVGIGIGAAAGGDGSTSSPSPAHTVTATTTVTAASTNQPTATATTTVTAARAAVTHTATTTATVTATTAASAAARDFGLSTGVYIVGSAGGGTSALFQPGQTFRAVPSPAGSTCLVQFTRNSTADVIATRTVTDGVQSLTVPASARWVVLSQGCAAVATVGA